MASKTSKPDGASTVEQAKSEISGRNFGTCPCGNHAGGVAELAYETSERYEFKKYCGEAECPGAMASVKMSTSRDEPELVTDGGVDVADESTETDFAVGDIVDIHLVTGDTVTARIWDTDAYAGMEVYSLEDEDGEWLPDHLSREDGEWNLSFSADVEHVEVEGDDKQDEVPEMADVVDIDEACWDALKEDGFLTALERSVIHRDAPHGYGVPRSIWMQGERTSYEDLTGEKPNVITPEPVMYGLVLARNLTKREHLTDPVALFNEVNSSGDF